MMLAPIPGRSRLGRCLVWISSSLEFSRSNYRAARASSLAMGVAPQACGFDTKRSMPSRWDKNFATSWPLTLLPAVSRGGANVPKPPLPGETVTMPPPIPLFPGCSGVVVFQPLCWPTGLQCTNPSDSTIGGSTGSDPRNSPGPKGRVIVRT